MFVGVHAGLFQKPKDEMPDSTFDLWVQGNDHALRLGIRFNET
jgi:hypothetical protein